MLPLREHWTIDATMTPVEVSLPELGTRPSDEVCEESYDQWFFIREMLRYPEPYYADELIATVLEIHEAVTARRERLFGDQRDDFVWERVFSDLDFAVRAGAVIFKEQVKYPLPVLDEPDDFLANYKPQPIVPENLTFIGVKITDQDGEPVVRSHVRIKLPDGDVKIVYTDSEGVTRIDGLAIPGMAEIELLDFPEAGEATAIEDEPVTPLEQEVKEFLVKVVDEIGKPLAGVPMVFSVDGTKKTVPTGGDGIAKHKLPASEAEGANVSVNFENASALWQIVNPIWQSKVPTPLSQYLDVSSDVVAVTARPTSIQSSEGSAFASLALEASKPRTLSVRPPKKRAVLVELHDTLFRNDSAVVNPEGEAPSAGVGEHESITTVGLVATILRYNEEHTGKKVFIAGHTDRAGNEGDNFKLSEQRAKAVLALVEGKKADYAAACGAKHSEVDVTQLFDWGNRQFGFTCKPTVMDRAPSDENYVKFRKSFNLWVKNGPAEGEKEARGTEIGQYGRLQPDIWEAMFDLYEYNLRDELGEDSGGVATLRQGLTWVDGDKKTVGFGEKHPTQENTVDGMRSQADRRVEVMFFDGGEEPNLAATNGEDIYDGVTFERRRVELDFPISERLYSPLQVWLFDEERRRMPNAPYRVIMPDGMTRTGCADAAGMVSETNIPDFETIEVQWGKRDYVDASGLPTSDDEASFYYAFGTTVAIHSAIVNGRIPELLSNLGHRGSESERRAAFEQFYASASDDLIYEVHATGKPA